MSTLRAVSCTSKIQLTSMILACKAESSATQHIWESLCIILLFFHLILDVFAKWERRTKDRNNNAGGEFWSPEMCPSQSEKTILKWNTIDFYTSESILQLSRFPWQLEIVFWNYWLFYVFLENFSCEAFLQYCSYVYVQPAVFIKSNQKMVL